MQGPYDGRIPTRDATVNMSTWYEVHIINGFLPVMQPSIRQYTVEWRNWSRVCWHDLPHCLSILQLNWGQFPFNGKICCVQIWSTTSGCGRNRVTENQSMGPVFACVMDLTSFPVEFIVFCYRSGLAVLASFCFLFQSRKSYRSEWFTSKQNVWLELAECWKTFSYTKTSRSFNQWNR